MSKSAFSPIDKFLLISIFSLVAFSCTKNEFKVKGTIEGAKEKPVLLEKANFNGMWFTIDSTYTNNDGAFAFVFEAPDKPEIFRITSDNRYIYFPVDSTETITINTSFENFGRDFSLQGSANAEMMAKFEKELQKARLSDPDSLALFKRNVFSNYMKDFRGSIVSYYILTKTIDGHWLYDPSDPSDRKYFSAVATGFKDLRPDDPRTRLLEETVLEALKQRNKEVGNYNTIEAPEISLIDMDLQDDKGQQVKLSSVAGKGKPVVVIFSMLNLPDSPELNMSLAGIYNRLGGNVEFYNVSLDVDPYDWRDVALNLPWITVFSPGGGYSQDALKYNVTQVPTFFVYDGNGELTARYHTVEELDKNL